MILSWLLPACVVLTGDDLRAHDLALGDTGTAGDGDTPDSEPDDLPSEADPVVLQGHTTCVDGAVEVAEDTDWFVVTDLTSGDTVEAWVEGLPDARLEERTIPDEPGVVLEAPPLVAVTAAGSSMWFGVSSPTGGDFYTLCLAKVQDTEVEPNDEPADQGTAGSMLVGPASGDLALLRATGVLQTASDVDRYRLEPRVGVAYTFALDATSAVEAATLVLVDAAGTELVRSAPGEAVLTWTAGADPQPVDLVVTSEAEATGAYTVWVVLQPPA